MRRTLASLLLVVTPLSATTAPDQWIEVRSPHFTVFADTSEKDARYIASQLERMRAVERALIPAASATSESPVIVLSLRDKKEFEALEPTSNQPGSELEVVGRFLRGTDKSYILLRPYVGIQHPFATIYYSFTDYMLRSVPLPSWLQVGLPRFYENAEIEDKNVQLGLPNDTFLRLLHRRSMVPIGALLAVDYKSTFLHSADDRPYFEAESWLLTHYLIFDDFANGTHRLQDYIQLTLQHVDPVSAARQAFGNLAQLQQALYNYLGQQSFRIYRMPQPAAPNETSFEARSIAATDVDAVRADVLTRTGRSADAEALLNAVLAADPKNEPAREVMGDLTFNKHDYSGAIRWYSEAAQLAPDSYLAKYGYALASIQNGDKEHDQEIESTLREVIRLRPDYARAYDSLATFYAKRHKKLDEAHMLSLQAVELEPDIILFRLNAADVLVQSGDLPSALNVLHTASGIARTPEQSQLVQTHIDRVLALQAAHTAAQ